MPRCQRTFRRLGEGETMPGTGVRQWTCRHCANGETYAAVRDEDLNAYARLAYDECVRWFGEPNDARWPTILVCGLRPECVREIDERRYDLYLAHGSDPWQLRLQIGHETFHRVCSQGRVFHWTHEMFACLVSLRLLRGCGLADYADDREAEWRAEAQAFSFVDLCGLDLWSAGPDYPPGFYGRAFVTGERLLAAVGWRRLCLLARSLNRGDATPDLDAWLARLPADVRASAQTVLDNAGPLAASG